MAKGVQAAFIPIINTIRTTITGIKANNIFNHKSRMNIDNVKKRTFNNMAGNKIINPISNTICEV